MSAGAPQALALADFNAASPETAFDLIMHWCAAPGWAQAVCASRPYASLHQLQSTTIDKWQAATDSDLQAAFAAHPVIGDVELLRTKYAAQANAEQGQVLQANEATIAELAAQNLQYSKRHGFTFIVFATGKSAEEMLALLKARINNTRAEEMRNAAAEQLKIMQLRLEQTITASPPPALSNTNQPKACDDS